VAGKTKTEAVLDAEEARLKRHNASDLLGKVEKFLEERGNEKIAEMAIGMEGEEKSRTGETLIAAMFSRGYLSGVEEETMFKDVYGKEPPKSKN
jgi:hypothetical protein